MTLLKFVTALRTVVYKDHTYTCSFSFSRIISHCFCILFINSDPSMDKTLMMLKKKIKNLTE